MTTVTSSAALQLAERAHALVQARPFQAAVLAEEAVELARANKDRPAQVAALHALGFARYVLGDPRALTTMRAAVRTGERHGYAHRAALARRNLAVYLAYAGKTGAAVREIEAASAALAGIERARTAVFRIAVFELAGRAEAGLAGSREALRVLRRHGDTAWEARVLYNRGAARAELGAARAARRDLERAADLYGELGFDAAVADARIKLARLGLLEGDPVACLTELDAIDVASLSDWASCWLFVTRAEALVALRLLPEARADLARFAETSTKAKALDSVDKVRLDAARLALLAGDPAAAASMAATARLRFAARGQAPFAAAAKLVSLGAAIGSGAVRRSTLRAGTEAAAELARAGFTVEALRGRLLVAHGAAIRGSRRTAARELAAARPLERRGTVADRIELRHVDALAHAMRGDRASAERALRGGLRLLDDYRGALGAIELRATVSAIGVELSREGLRIAMETGDPRRILVWAERLRGSALRLPFVRPPQQAELQGLQAELRRVAGRMREDEGRKKVTRVLAGRQSQLESEIRSRTRQVRGEERASSAAIPDPRDASRALGERALVEYVELDGRVRALTLARGRLAFHDLSADDVGTELEWLRFALGRLARRGITRTERRATLGTAQASAVALDRLLVEPLLPVLGRAPLVIVPTGALHALPWGALPSLRGRPVVAAPSLAVWHRLARRRPGSRRRGASFVAGPRLRHSDAEVRDVAAFYRDPTVLAGAEANATAVLAALDGAGLAHVACHGNFRSDSPLFSSLELADGPLTALDLQRLRRAPDVLVLSACDLALSDRRPGDELLGLSAALLAMGTRSIVASVVPVPDATARRLMLAFHRELARGSAPAAALAHAQATLRGDSAAIGGFVCLGSG